MNRFLNWLAWGILGGAAGGILVMSFLIPETRFVFATIFGIVAFAWAINHLM